MTELNNVNDLFDTLAKVLLRCFVMGYCLLLLWFVLYLFAGVWVYGSGKWFGLMPHEVDIIHFCGISLVKCVVVLFFLCPYIAIRMVLRKRT